jgi:hypothetical protein
MNDNNLFEPISKEEYERVHRHKPAKRTRRTRELVTEPRNNTTWYGLPHVMGFCTCPYHDDIQRMLHPDAQVYRQKYPVRMTFEIREGLPICRDCFLNEGDK